MSDDRQTRMSELLRRRADIYALARQRPSYYGDDDIDLLRTELADEVERRRAVYNELAQVRAVNARLSERLVAADAEVDEKQRKFALLAEPTPEFVATVSNLVYKSDTDIAYVCRAIVAVLCDDPGPA